MYVGQMACMEDGLSGLWIWDIVEFSVFLVHVGMFHSIVH